MIIVLFTMKHDKWKVFIPAIFTMVGMHVISVGFGTSFPLLFSRNTIVYFSVFLFFGVMMIYEAYNMQSKLAEEKVMELQSDLLAEKTSELREIESKGILKESSDIIKSIDSTTDSPELTAINTENEKLSMEGENAKNKIYNNPYIHLVLLLFLAGWGDRCQISAIELTATRNAWGVAVGGGLVLVQIKE